jgi:SAM-dependent methyltransferase
MSVNQEQKDFWSDQAGQKWIEYQADMDRLFDPILQLVLKEANLKTGETVLDIGCGAGTSTSHAAQLVGPMGHCTGADISDTLLNHGAATLNRNNTSWLLADAQTHPFAPNSFDAMISRFGVMFFKDTVAAFQNIKSSLKPIGRVTMAAWGPAKDNPWFMFPARAAKERLGQMPKTDRSLPGPFAFEDHERVLRQVEAAGFTDCDVQTLDMKLDAGPDIEKVATLCCEIGPVVGALNHFNASQADADAIASRIAELFSPYETGGGIYIPASIHLFSARVG